MAEERSPHQTILVVGGGMSGLTAALEAAEAGYEAIIVEKNPYLGGRVAQLNQYFPKFCPPSCGLEINFRRLRSNPRVRVFTGAELVKLSGQAGQFTAAIKFAPRYINENCTACGKCAEVVATKVKNPFDYNQGEVKGVRLPHPMAYPNRYVMDEAVAKGPDGPKAKEVCPCGAVDLDAKEKTVELPVGAVVWAAGWSPYEAAKLETYGFGKYPNLVTNVMMERLAAADGPTAGKILRPSDGQEPKSVAFIQCAGSRDINHLPFCSGVCCLASIKQANYVRAKLPQADCQIMFIDIRAQDRLEEVYQKAQADAGIKFVKSKVAKITEDPATHNLVLEGENTTTGQKYTTTVELAVLATGMAPNNAALPVEGVKKDEYGFIPADSGLAGFVAAGCVRKPYNVAECVQDATRAALKAVQVIVRR